MRPICSFLTSIFRSKFVRCNPSNEAASTSFHSIAWPMPSSMKSVQHNWEKSEISETHQVKSKVINCAAMGVRTNVHSVQRAADFEMSASSTTNHARCTYDSERSHDRSEERRESEQS